MIVGISVLGAIIYVSMCVIEKQVSKEEDAE